MRLTDFGRALQHDCGVVSLMDDMATALADEPDTIMLGGGNPAHIDAVEDYLAARLATIAANRTLLRRSVGLYDPPQGNREVRRLIANALHNRFGWSIDERHVALTAGSQSAFAMLFRLFAGQTDGQLQRILLPLCPEYIGYGDIGIDSALFHAVKPTMTIIDDMFFKYGVDFSKLTMDGIGAICVSRPCNPTGNVITDDELRQLHKMARQHDVPLIVDNAYGAPFPNILFRDAEMWWDEQVVLCFSLSKLGLPGVRTGIVVAAEPIIEAIKRANAIFQLAPNSIGAQLVADAFASGDIFTISDTIIRPWYADKARNAIAAAKRHWQPLGVRLHALEGGFFLWFWREGLHLDSHTLYQRLKAQQVLVLSGHHFFFGLPPSEDNWRHRHECLRIGYAQPASLIDEGFARIAAVLRENGHGDNCPLQ